jgi:hypothetical protein
MRSVRKVFLPAVAAIALLGAFASVPEEVCAQGCTGLSCQSSGNFRCADWHCGYIWLGE